MLCGTSIELIKGVILVKSTIHRLGIDNQGEDGGKRPATLTDSSKDIPMKKPDLFEGKKPVSGNEPMEDQLSATK